MERRNRFLETKAAANLMLLTTALLWGSSYAFRKAGMEHLTPFFFNFLRFFVACAAMLALCIFFGKFRRKGEGVFRSEEAGASGGAAGAGRAGRGWLYLKGGFFSGTAIALGAAVQQWALLHTTAGKVGFITSLYTVFVPVLTLILFRARIRAQIWAAVAIACTGLFLISANRDMSINPGDAASLISAVAFAFHIIIVGRYSPRADGLILSTVQMLFGCLWNLGLTFLLEEGNTLADIRAGSLAVLYTGIFSIGVSFTLQVFAQKRTAPSVAAIIMSLESVFAVLFGALLLSESMTPLQTAGCGLIFSAVLVAQLEKKTAGVSEKIEKAEKTGKSDSTETGKKRLPGKRRR